MTLPVCHALLVSEDSAFLARWLAGLQESGTAEQSGSQRFTLEFQACDAVQQMVARVLADGLVQAVILDAAGQQDLAGCVAALRGARAELDVFVAAQAGSVLPGLEVQLFDRDDAKATPLLRKIRSALQRRASTPFADTLRDYVYSAKDAWHTPGHSGGDALSESPWVADFYHLMGEHIFNTDLSVSVQSLDSLLDPHSIIQEAQDLAADAFGARRTFFVTNGTSTANKVILQHLVGNGGKLLVDQACHKSIHHGIVLSGAQPVYLAATLNPHYGFYGPARRETVLAAIAANPDARLLVLTACTYDGLYYDLPPLISAAHEHGMKVLVDEAWYAHGRFHPRLRPCALESGADYVTQSTHKMLSAFSQASMIHVGDPDFDEARFREHLNMHTSTSPQYAMIASLDVARKQMSMEGYLQLSRRFSYVEQLREGINATGVFRVLSLEDILPQGLEHDGVRLDPTKITVDVSASSRGARWLQLALFEQFGIQAEKATHNTLSLLVTLGTTQGKCLRLVNALATLARSASKTGAAAVEAPATLPALTPMRALPRDAFFGPAKFVPLRDRRYGVNPALLDAVSAELVVPYPPGIPVLVPGQQVSEADVSYLTDLYCGDSGIELHGLAEEGGEPGLRVVATPSSLPARARAEARQTAPSSSGWVDSENCKGDQQ